MFSYKQEVEKMYQDHIGQSSWRPSAHQLSNLTQSDFTPHPISVEKSGPSREELAARATAAMPTQAVISKSMMTSVQGLVGETKTVLSAGELQRMKEITMKEEERVARAKAELEATKGAAQRKADARKQKTAYEISVRDWSSDVCSSDLMVKLRIKMYLFFLSNHHPTQTNKCFLTESHKSQIICSIPFHLII